MNKKFLMAGVMTVLGTGGMGVQAAILNSGDMLTINGGIASYDAYGNQTNVTGSWFAMDYNGNGAISGNEKNALSMGDTGIVIGVTTSAGASHSGCPVSFDHNAITAPWCFFGNTGSDYVTTAITGSTTAGLDFSGWTVAWNGIAAIPMGGGAWGAGFSNGVANLTWNGTYGTAYTLDYHATVPTSDASGFGGVRYALHLEGTGGLIIEQPTPVPAAAWLFGSGLLGLMGVARRRRNG